MSELKDHVRLKPRNSAAGHVMRDYGAPWGIIYKEGVWYVEPPELALERGTYLKTIRMNSMDDYSPKAFNVCTRAEAERIKLLEEAGDLEQVREAVKQIIPPAPTEPGATELSPDLNLPSPKSELAAAAQAAVTAGVHAAAQPPDPPAPPPEAPQAPQAPKATKKGSTKTTTRRPRARRRNPGK